MNANGEPKFISSCKKRQKKKENVKFSLIPHEFVYAVPGEWAIHDTKNLNIDLVLLFEKIYQVLHWNTEVYTPERLFRAMNCRVVFLFFFSNKLFILLRRLPRNLVKDVACSWANTLWAALHVPGSIKFLYHFLSCLYTVFLSLQHCRH